MRGLVKITETEVSGRRWFVAACTRCGWGYENTVKSDVDTHKRWHRCPEVTP